MSVTVSLEHFGYDLVWHKLAVSVPGSLVFALARRVVAGCSVCQQQEEVHGVEVWHRGGHACKKHQNTITASQLHPH